MASYDPSDYDSVYSEEEFMDVVQGATTPPLMNYDEFLAKTMGESLSCGISIILHIHTSR